MGRQTQLGGVVRRWMAGARKQNSARRLRQAVEALEGRVLLAGAAVEQWASEVLSYSSQWGLSGDWWTARRALGAPDVTSYGMSPYGWVPAEMDGGMQSIALGFAAPVRATGVVIRENSGNGFVAKVELLDPAGGYSTAWEGVDPTPVDAPRDFRIDFAETSHTVSAVRVTIDTTRRVWTWEEIDAVQLIGTEVAGSPTVQTLPVTPDPRSMGVDRVTIRFSEPVVNFDLGDLELKRNAEAVALEGMATLELQGEDWILGNLEDLTSVDGNYELTLRALGSGIVDGEGNSLLGPASITFRVDRTGPVASIAAVAPDPRNIPVEQISIQFSEPVTGFELADLSLSRDGGGNLLAGSTALLAGSGEAYTLSLPAGLTSAPGTYALALRAAGSGIIDSVDNAMIDDAVEQWAFDPRPNEVRGTVYHDLNTDGVRQEGEIGIEGWTVYVDANNNGAPDAGEISTQSSAEGAYTLAGIASGSWTVRLVPQPLWVITPNNDNARNISVSAGQLVEGIDFSVATTGSASGAVWEDLDGDGVRDENEPGLANWLIFADTFANGKPDQATQATYNNTLLSISDSGTVTSSITAAGGIIADVNVSVRLTHARMDELDVFLISPAGQRIELFTDAGGERALSNTTIKLDDEAGVSIAGESPLGLLGVYRPEAPLSVLDGQRVDGEWRLEISDDTAGNVGSLLAWSVEFTTWYEPAVVTDSQGEFLLSGLAPTAGAGLKIAAAAPGGWSFTSANRGSVTVPILSAQTAAGISFGAGQAGSVSGRVWNDADRDGARDEGEAPVAGRTVFADMNGNGHLERQSGYLSTSGASIPDGGLGRAIITANGWPGVITALTTTISINHAKAGQLQATLISPAGTRVPLFANVGGDSAGFTGATFDDAAATSIQEAAAPFNGTYRPVGSLASLNGESPNGVWALEILDTVSGEQGMLGNWTLSLVSGDPQAKTADDGTYRISTVPAGTISVRQEPVTAWGFTAPASGAQSVAVGSAQDVQNIDFGVARLPSDIVGVVYHDRNASGKQEADEEGVAGVTLLLENGLTAETDVRGQYAFRLLEPGTYRVQPAPLAGWLRTLPAGYQVVTIQYGETKTAEFGMAHLGHVQGSAWEDRNNDAIRQEGEPPLGNLVVYVDANNNGNLDASLRTETGAAMPIADNAVTRSTITLGQVSGTIVDVDLFLDLTHERLADLDAVLVSPSGKRVELFSGLTRSGTRLGPLTLDDSAAASIASDTAGSLFRPMGALSALIGDEPAGAWTLEITDHEAGSAGTLTSWALSVKSGERAAITDAQGHYAIRDLVPGRYGVRFVLPGQEWVSTVPKPGMPLNIDIRSEETATADVAAYHRPSDIAGVVWHDLNGDGKRTADEPGLRDRTVRLNTGQVATTNESGEYRFAYLPIASYTVSVDSLAGWYGTTPASISRASSPGQTAPADFGQAVHSAIRGSVWEDVNQDRQRQTTEVGAAGLTVFVDLNGNSVADAPGRFTVTGSTGPINDNATTLFTTAQSGIGNDWVQDLDVRLTLSHPRVEDLSVTLISPAGTRVKLFSGLRSAIGVQNAVLDDSAVLPIRSGIAPYSASFHPEQPLRAMVNEFAAGTWQLEVVDSVAEATGSMIAWSLQLVTGEPAAVTDASGAFVLPNLRPGNLNVRLASRTDWAPTEPSSGLQVVALRSGQQVEDLAFGAFHRPSDVTGVVYHDIDGNRYMAPDEPGLANRLVYAATEGAGPYGRTVYSDDVPIVVASATARSTLNVADVGFIGDVNAWMDISVAQAQSASVTLISPSGKRVLLFSRVGGSGRDFRNTTLNDEVQSPIASAYAPFNGSFSPQNPLSAFDGENADGEWTLEAAFASGTENRLNGWGLVFTQAVATDDQGRYALRHLPVGPQTIRILPRSEDRLTEPPAGSFNVNINLNQIIENRNFGLANLGQILGTVWEDANSNGTRDAGEGPIPGRVVYLDADRNGQFNSILYNNNVAPGVAVPDGGSAQSALNVPLQGAVHDVDVAVALYHGTAEQVDLTLVSPAGTRVPLVRSIANGASETITTFDDESPTSLRYAIGSMPGLYKPATPLSVLDGQPTQGSWTLEITDKLKNGQITQLRNWTLKFMAGEPIAMTNAEGAYVFPSLMPGVYYVGLAPREGWQVRAPSNGIRIAPLASGQTLTGTDFGVFHLPSDVSGVVWHDLNANGVREANEPGLPNRFVYTDAEPTAPVVFTSDAPAATIPASSPAGGPGVLRSILNLSGLNPIADLNITFSIAHANPYALTAWLISPAGTRVKLFSQVNAPNPGFAGTQLSDETARPLTNTVIGMAGGFKPQEALSAFDGQDPNGAWTLEVSNNVAVAGSLVAWSLSIGQPAETDANGAYMLRYLPAVPNPPTQTIRQVVPAGAWMTSPTKGNYPIQIGYGSWFRNADFGNASFAEISGIIYNDENRNGQRDEDEAGVGGVPVLLDADNDGIRDLTTRGVNAGSSMQIPASQVTRLPINVASIPGVIGDLDVNLSMYDSLMQYLTVDLISPAGTRATLFSKVGSGPASLVGFIFDDSATAYYTGTPMQPTRVRPVQPFSAFNGEEANGTWYVEVTGAAPNSNGSLGVVQLIFATGEAQVLTDDSGYYAFSRVRPGTYQVRPASFPGWINIDPESGVRSYTVQSDEGISADFGRYHRHSDIAGSLWRDSNANGLRDESEGPLASRAVYADGDDAGALLFTANPNVSLAPNKTTTVELTLANVPRRISDLNVSLTVESITTYLLEAYLVSPDGIQVELFKNLANLPPRSFPGTTLSDEAAKSIREASVNFSGAWRPTGSLSAFDGKNANGTWKLHLVNRDTINTGARITGWSLSVGQLSAVSDAQGNYVLPYLPPGTHNIRQALTDAGWIQTFPAEPAYRLEIDYDEVLENVNFASGQGGAILGRVWLDANGDGVRQESEGPISGRTLYLDTNNNGRFDRLVIDPDDFVGKGAMNSLVPGVTLSAISSYSGAARTVHAHYEGADAPTGAHAFGASFGGAWSASDIFRAEFAKPATSVSIDVRVLESAGSWVIFEAFNTAGELVAGVTTSKLSYRTRTTLTVSSPRFDISTVQIRCTVGRVLYDNLVLSEPFTKSEPNGEYMFQQMPPGAYNVGQLSESTFLQTFPARTDNEPSDPVHRVGFLFDAIRRDLDFGNLKINPGRISGMKWNDVDGDGVRDENEPALVNWTVYLDANDNGWLDAGEPYRVTAADGSYVFDNLAPGNYIVREELRAGFRNLKIRTGPPRGPSASADVVFEDVPLVSLPKLELEKGPLVMKLSETQYRAFMATPYENRKAFAAAYRGYVEDDQPGWWHYAVEDGTASPTSTDYDFEDLLLHVREIAGGLVQIDFDAHDTSKYHYLIGASGQLVSGPVGVPTTGIMTLTIPNPDAPWRRSSSVEAYRDTVGAAEQVFAAQDFGNVFPLTATPSAVRLLAESDTGASDADGVTRLDNSTPEMALRFEVEGVTPGALVTVYASGMAIGSAVAEGTSVVVTTDGSTRLLSRTYAVTAGQVMPGEFHSGRTAAVNLVIDPIAPSATITQTARSADGRSVNGLMIVLSDPAPGMALENWALRRNGGENLLGGAESFSGEDGLTWVLGDLSSLTGESGYYALEFTAGALVVADVAGNVMSDGPAGGWMQLNGTEEADRVEAVVPADEPNRLAVYFNAAETPSFVAPVDGVQKVFASLGAGLDELMFGGGSFALELSGEAVALTIGGKAKVELAEVPALRGLALAGEARATAPAWTGGTLRTAGLSIADTGTLDLMDHALIVESDEGHREEVLGKIEQWVRSGSAGRWNGTGITSWAAAANAEKTVAVLGNWRRDGSAWVDEFEGEAVDEGSILLGYRNTGDADLNGVVDADDYFRIDRGRLGGASTYAAGDFDHNGVVDADDYALIDAAFVAGRTAAGGGDGGSMAALAEVARPAAKKPEEIVQRGGKELKAELRPRKGPGRKAVRELCRWFGRNR